MNTFMINFFLVNVDFVRDIVLNAFAALLTDLSKAFHCIDQTLLIAKLSAFGVSPLSVKSDSHVPKKIFLFASMIALQKS